MNRPDDFYSKREYQTWGTWEHGKTMIEAHAESLSPSGTYQVVSGVPRRNAYLTHTASTGRRGVAFRLDLGIAVHTVVTA